MVDLLTYTRIAMPTTPLSAGVSANDQEKALTPLCTAISNMHGSAGIDFAKAVFGVQTAEEAIQKRKDDMKGMPVNGSFGENGVCTCLMRTYVALIKMKEDGNAAALREIAEQKFPKEVVAEELRRVEAGW